MPDIDETIEEFEFEFHFCMNKHCRDPVHDSLNAIAKWIAAQTPGENFELPGEEVDLEYPFHVILSAITGARIARIHEGHPLWRYLDDQSQASETSGRSLNYLIWIPDSSSKITVTHFGPFSRKRKVEKLEEQFSNSAEKLC